jgi:thiosulfate dehydrogenase [quinone] large subunit
MTTSERSGPVAAGRRPRFANSWATTPLRVFLSSVFLFASYAKLTYPGFFNPNASFGFKSAVANAKKDTPLSGLMGPLADHPSLYGHITAFAELAIGLGLLVGLLTRVAALGGMVLAASIVLSVNWFEVREYTGNGGWFTSVDLAVIAGLSVFLLGGAGPLSLDAWYVWSRARRRDRVEAGESAFADRDADLEDSKRRLRGDQFGAAAGGADTDSFPVSAGSAPSGSGDQRTEQLPDLRPNQGSLASAQGAPARRTPVTDEDSMWASPADDDRR